MTSTFQRNGARFLKITDWADRRYRKPNAKGEMVLLITAAGPRPSRYTRIEDMAATAYLGSKERNPGIALRDCPAF